MNFETRILLDKIYQKIQDGVLLEDEENAAILEQFSSLMDTLTAMGVRLKSFDSFIQEIENGEALLYFQTTGQWKKAELMPGRTLELFRTNPPKVKK